MVTCKWATQSESNGARLPLKSEIKYNGVTVPFMHGSAYVLVISSLSLNFRNSSPPAKSITHHGRFQQDYVTTYVYRNDFPHNEGE